MRRVNFPLMTPVIVSWEDTITEGSSQFDGPQDAMREYKPYVRKSLGFFVGYAERDGRKAVLIATDDDRREASPHALGGISTIPLGMVLSIDPVVPERKAKK